MGQNKPLFMTIRELMAVLGIKSRETVYAHMRTHPGFPKPRLLGYKLIWRIRDVEAYADSLPEAHGAVPRQRREASGVEDLV